MRIVTTLIFSLVLGISTAFSQGADVQIVHASPYADVDTVHIYVNGTATFNDVAYGTATAFTNLAAGTYTIDVVHKDSTDNNNPLFSADLALADGDRFVVFAAGNPFDEEDDNTAPFGYFPVAAPAAVTTAGNAEVGIFHGASDAPPVSIKVRGADANITDSLAFGNATGFLDLAASDIIVELYTNVGGLLIGSYTAPLSTLADNVVTVFARGIYNNGTKFDPFGVSAVLADGSVVALAKVDEPVYPYPVDPDTPLLDNTIFFIDGLNTSISFGGGNSTLAYADMGGNKVLRTGGNDFGSRGWTWDDGINMESMVSGAAPDTLFIRMRVLPDDNPALGIVIQDMSADNGPVTQDDINFDVRWPIPEEDYTGEFIDYAIPLPMMTKAEHDTAVARGNITGDRARWQFTDAWSGSYSIGPADPLWKDITWYNIRRIGVNYAASGSGTLEIDYMYIGDSRLSQADLDAANAAPSSALPALTTSTDNDSVSVSWTHDSASDIQGYELYYSASAASGYTDANQNFLGLFGAPGADDPQTFTVKIPVSAGHPEELSNSVSFMLYPTNGFSAVPATAAPATATQSYTKEESIPYIYPLSADEEALILGNLDAGTVGPEGFRADQQYFDLSPDRVTVNNDGDNYGPSTRENASAYAAASTQEEDFSAKIWMAYRYNAAEDYTTFYIYGEVMDSDIDELTDLENTGGTWQHDFSVMKDNRLPWNVYSKDMINFHMGTYETDFVTGASGLRSRGAEPDYFVSFTPYVTLNADEEDPAEGLLSRLWLEEAGTIDSGVGDSTWYYNSEHPFVYSPVFENMFLADDHPNYTDAAGAEGTANYMGYRFLAAIDAEDLLAAPGANDVAFTPPGDDEIKYIPFAINAIDRDDESPWWGSGVEITYNSTGDRVFENASSTDAIGSVAVVGVNKVVTSNEQEDNTVPFKYSLDQNYPNPFNPSTAIKFSLPAAESVNLAVYNLLGQRVATLVSNQQFSAGVHTVNFDASRLASGVYFYRLETDGFTATKKMMLVK